MNMLTSDALKIAIAVMAVSVSFTGFLLVVAAARLGGAIRERGVADLQQFRVAALALIEDASVPQTVAQFVERLSHEAGRPRLARWMAREILSGRLEMPTSPKTEISRQFGEDIGRLTQDQQQRLAQSVGYCLMSSASANLLTGATYLRRVIHYGLFDSAKRVEPDKARAIVVEYADRRRRRDLSPLARIVPSTH